jgi:hypothetical protein
MFVTSMDLSGRLSIAGLRKKNSSSKYHGLDPSPTAVYALSCLYSAHAIRSMFIPILLRLFFGGRRARCVRATPGLLVLLLWVWLHKKNIDLL